MITSVIDVLDWELPPLLSLLLLLLLFCEPELPPEETSTPTAPRFIKST